ncbi:MAG: NAD(P)/FAD-dependent oxidoreductase [Oscillospiraceae bacterium]
MAIIVSQIKTSLDEPRDNALEKAMSRLALRREEIESVRLYKTSVDARKDICFVSSVYIQLKNPAKEKKLAEKYQNVRLYGQEELKVHFGSEKPGGDIFIAGFGPAGMFCALTLCEFGYKPVVLERGADMDRRICAVEGFWSGGALDPATNVQFGEGGAGTFSDGKLTTRIGDPLCTRVLERFVEFGAPEEILTQAKPHIGTDKLRDVVKNLRQRVLELGGEIRFLSPLTGVDIGSGRVQSIQVNGAELPCGVLALAVGHSAHDTFRMLHANGVELIPKPFSVGARIEHLQTDINRALYGKHAEHPALPPAEYQLSYHDSENRGVYTFCMCPGGYVVASASEPGTVVTNGMSYYDRAGKNANSAVLVSVSPDDFGGGALGGMEFIQQLEQRAFQLGKSGKAPAALTREFVSGGNAFTLGRVDPTYSLGVEPANLDSLFPQFVSQPMKEALRYFDRRIPGFSDSDSILTAIESRSSSPVRLPRNEAGHAACADNLFPCGEGCGYAGGIMSAAVDGIRTAVKIMEKYAPYSAE